MALPGINVVQMAEVDRIMTEERGVPVGLMMEHAGLNLARLAVRLSGRRRHTYLVIAGAGNNGGGGLVAARRLDAWGFEVEVYLARGKQELHKTPRRQLERLEKASISVYEGLPIQVNSSVILDAYMGYGYKPPPDAVSQRVFDFLTGSKTVISLDTPSGLDVTSGQNASRSRPLATMTLAFVKSGLLAAGQDEMGDLYIADIGVPNVIYRQRLGINWRLPHNPSALEKLAVAFRRDSLQPIVIHRDAVPARRYWQVATKASWATY
jgi:NAD(P)H-hydrate epimerase